MREYFTIISKYLILLFMAFYTLEGILAFLYRNEEDKKTIYIRENIWMFLMQATAFGHLTLVSGDWEYVYLYIYVQVFLGAMLILPPLIYKKCNRQLLNHMCMFIGIGMIILSRLSRTKTIRQFQILCIAFVISMFLPLIMDGLKRLSKLRWLYGAAGIGLLGAVLAIGEFTNGSRLSFTVHGITLQPSEFVKILFVFFLAASLYEDCSLKNILWTSLVCGLHVIILVLSTDLGSGLIYFVCFLALVYIGTRKLRYLLAGLAGGVGASVLAYYLFPHVRVRVLAWLDPWSYIDNQGYQITQSLFGIGTGSWFGLGLSEGNPKAIPYVEADFIFSAICEEFGALFGVLLLIAILNCFLTMMDISIMQHNPFHRLIVAGLGTIYIFQVFLTVGGGIKFIPLTGVTLPFISYGGSSVMTTMMMFFIIQGIYISGKKEGELHQKERKINQKEEQRS